MDEKKIKWSPEAVTSFLEILEYFFERNKSRIYSEKLKDHIVQSIKYQSKHPYIGRETEMKGVRELNYEVYQIYYEITQNEIRILLIWDGRRNPENLNIFLKK